MGRGAGIGRGERCDGPEICLNGTTNGFLSGAFGRGTILAGRVVTSGAVLLVQLLAMVLLVEAVPFILTPKNRRITTVVDSVFLAA
jgi:hypothetical protein